MLAPEQKATAQLAWQNFSSKHPERTRGMTEDQFIGLIEELEKSYRSGLVDQSVYSERLDSLLATPESALEVTTFIPTRQTTDKLLNELKDLRKRNFLTEDEFQERKAELFFERGVENDPDVPIPAGEQGLMNKKKYADFLEQLLGAGILDKVGYETAMGRIEKMYH